MHKALLQRVHDPKNPFVGYSHYKKDVENEIFF